MDKDFTVQKLKSKCSDGDDCFLLRWPEDRTFELKLGGELYLLSELLSSDQDFWHRRRQKDKKRKLTRGIEFELVELLPHLPYPCDRADIHEMIDYDS
jgi:hypothetical protein